MKRLTRAIAEIESFRDALIRAPWKNPSEIAAVGLLNTAVLSLTQVEALTMFRKRMTSGATNTARASELINQINDELRDEQEELR